MGSQDPQNIRPNHCLFNYSSNSTLHIIKVRYVQDSTRKWLIIEDSLSIILMAILACITMANVLVRYFSTQSFAWTEEISIFLMILLTLVGSSSAFVRYQHISIDLLVKKCAPKKSAYISLMASGCSLLFFIFFTVLSAKLCADEMEFGDISPALGISTWKYTIFLPIFSVLISIRLLRQFFCLWQGIAKQSWLNDEVSR